MHSFPIFYKDVYTKLDFMYMLGETYTLFGENRHILE